MFLKKIGMGLDRTSGPEIRWAQRGPKNFILRRKIGPEQKFLDPSNYSYKAFFKIKLAGKEKQGLFSLVVLKKPKTSCIPKKGLLLTHS